MNKIINLLIKGIKNPYKIINFIDRKFRIAEKNCREWIQLH